MVASAADLAYLHSCTVMYKHRIAGTFISFFSSMQCRNSRGCFPDTCKVQLVLTPASQNIQNRTPTSISVEPSAGPATEIAAVQAQKAKATRYRALVSSSTIPVSQQEKEGPDRTTQTNYLAVQFSGSLARARGRCGLARSHSAPAPGNRIIGLLAIARRQIIGRPIA